ncbi:MAG: family 20 glycosylhydrolase, partial [Chitinophagaceae bacterium]
VRCQQRMKDEHLKNEHELQSYFTQRMEKFLNSFGKSIIGWDEILEGGLAPNATVMSWRGDQGGINAAQQNHDVIMTPNNYCYLDYYQSQDPGEPLAIGGYLPLEKVYSLDPIPAELTDEEAKHIKGLQGNLWTEYIPTSEKLEYMLMPRALAIAEVGWTKLNRKNYDDFLDRVKIEFNRLDRMKVNHGQHLFGLTWNLKRKNGDMELSLKTRSNGSIRYTTDGSDPTPRSVLYRNPIEINKAMLLRAQVFEDGKPLGAAFNKQFIYHKAIGKEVSLKEKPHKNYDPGNASALCNGLEGSDTFDDNQWFAYSGTDLDATIDLGKSTWVKEFGFNYISNANAWIYAPSSVTFYASQDGKEFAPLVSFTEFTGEGKINRKAKMDKVKARYIRVVAKNYGKIPAGKTGEGHPAWLFMDEIMVD